MDPIKILENLEPVFKQAGQLACQMQATAKHHNKTQTGSAVSDIVTEADLAVQEFLLREILKTDLINCRLLAEEDTPLAKKFTGKNQYYLAIDPIDGTLVYSKGGQDFGILVSLHDGKNLLYTFKHFPALGFTLKIVKSNFEWLGPIPHFSLPAGLGDKILYYEGDPQNTAPELYLSQTKSGLVFAQAESLKLDVCSTTVFLMGQAAGFYAENTNVYDGLLCLHFARATKKQVFSSGHGGLFDFSKIQKKPTGLYYPGYYLVLNDRVSPHE